MFDALFTGCEPLTFPAFECVGWFARHSRVNCARKTAEIVESEILGTSLDVSEQHGRRRAPAQNVRSLQVSAFR